MYNVHCLAEWIAGVLQPPKTSAHVLFLMHSCHKSNRGNDLKYTENAAKDTWPQMLKLQWSYAASMIIITSSCHQQCM